MTENQIEGSATNAVGNAEADPGSPVGSRAMESGGRSGETAGVVQGSIGRATEAVKNLVAGGPGAVSRLAEQSRERFQRADAAIGRRLGNGIFYIWGGVALAAIGVFFYGRRKERTGADEAQAHPS